MVVEVVEKMEAFERVLINWINCLKFADPIQELDDLKNGIFLHTLQTIISRKNFPSVGTTDTLTFLFKLLELHYPKFIVDNKSNIHLNDLPHETLVCVVALILHYICIYDRRPVLASSLCTELDTSSQLAIKTFLEKISECAEIDNATLVQVMNSSIENEKAEGAQKESPLQLLLKTPISKANRLLKRDQEIANLLTEVELLQEEKERLEEDIKTEREKNKTLGKQLNNKNEEISQLRCEILVLEGRTPPNYQDADLRESQKILRTKVETLEEIIKQNYAEYDELTNKREEDRAQLKTLESQCNMWLTKFIDSNNQLHILSELCEDQEIKLKNFERHCNELEALLEEMKSKSIQESFLEESFKSSEIRMSSNSQSFMCSEDLAHSVVDLQLKEKQHENTVLQSAVKNAESVNEELRELNHLLRAERDELQNKLLIKEDFIKKVSQDLKTVMTVNREMFKDQTDLNLKQKAIEDCKDEENNSVEVDENELEIEKLCSEVIIMTNNFKAALLENNTVVNNLMLDICDLRQECQQITNHNQVLTVQCSDLRESLSSVEKQKEELEEKLQKSESDLKLAVRDKEVNQHKWKHTVEANSILRLQCSNLMERLSAVMKLKDELEKDFQKSENDLEMAIKDKQIALANYVKCIAFLNLFFLNYRNLLVFVYLLHVSNNTLNTRMNRLLRRLFQLGNDRQLLLKQASENYKNIAVLETQNNKLFECLSLASEEKNRIEEKCKQIENDFFSVKAAYEKYKKLSEERASSHEQKQMAISLSLQSTMKQLETCSQEKEVLTTQIESFKMQVDKLSEENQTLQLTFEEAQTEYQTMKRKQFAIMDAQAQALEKAECASSRYLQMEFDMSRQIEKLENEKVIMQEEFDKNLMKVREAYLNVDNLAREKWEISHSLESTLKQLEMCSLEKETLTETVESYKTEIDKLSETIESYKKEIDQLSETVESYKKEIDRLSKQNETLRFSLEEAKTEYQTMKEKQSTIMDTQADALQKAEYTSSRYIQTTLDMSGHMEKLETEKAIIQKELDKNLKELNEAYSKVDRIEREKLEMSQSLEYTLKQLETCSLKNETVTGTVESLKEKIENLCEENKTLRFSLEEAATKNENSKENQYAILETQATAYPLQLKLNMFDRVDKLETEKASMQKEFEKNLKKTQEAYSKIVTMNSALDMENASIKKKIKGLSKQLEEHAQIKEAYEKLLEENSKLQTERDTVKYKRLRDREEFMKMIKKEREDVEAMASRKIKEIRHDYEVKAELMREQLLKLYNDEVKKEIQKVNQGGGKNQSFYQQQTEELRKQLSEAKYKIRMLELEHELTDRHSSRAIMYSRESLVSLPERSSQSFYLDRPENAGKPLSGQLCRKVKSISTMRTNNSRRASTLPRSQFAEIKETVTIAEQSSLGAHANIGNLEMEDEDDDFNNKYLMDLKAGRCVVNKSGRESDASRVSELAWRNSLMPPHLKSSYPVEAQFYSPSKFKEDDLKAGNIDLDNSQSKLLPSEKPRQKKDFGTTSYRKPGPPTPSKNARLSQPNNEVQPLREQNERTPKRSTPSRIRMMFTGKSSTSQVKDNTENQTDTPKTHKRLSLFRKQK